MIRGSLSALLTIAAFVLAACGGAATSSSGVPTAPPTPSATIRYTPIPRSPTPTPVPVPSPTRRPGTAFLDVRFVDASGAASTYSRLGPEVLVYRAEPATCAYFRQGGGPGTVDDSLVVDWGHARPDGTIRLVVASPGRYVILAGNPFKWWKNKASCESADVFVVSGDTKLDIVD